MPPAVPVARAWGHVELVLPSLMGGNGGDGCMKGCIRWTQSYAGMRAAHRLDTLMCAEQHVIHFAPQVMVM